jgi:hypothetical protein
MKATLTATVLALTGSMALAGSVTFDAALTFPGSTNLNGVVTGSSGISNANFVRAINDDAGVEIGLKAIARFTGDLNNTNEVYRATTGTSVSPTGLVGSTWNYVTAVNLGTGTLSDYQVDLLLDFNPATGVNDYVTLDYNAAIAALGGDLSTTSTIGDSQNFDFSFWSTAYGAPDFDPNALGEYGMILRVSDASGIVAEVTNTVVVVPVPTAAFAGLGLLGSLAGIRAIRRR